MRSFSPRPKVAPSLILIAAVAPSTLVAAQTAVDGDSPPTLLVSTTSDPGAVLTVGPDLDDSSIVRVRAGDEPLPWMLEGHWRALADFVPSDVDGFSHRTGSSAFAAESVAFSLLSNEGGFLDGDVLTLAPGGGVEILLTEDSIATALGAPGAAIDLDAIAFDELGRLVFSLQSDLAGTALGDLSNGDVLMLAEDGPERLATEADVEAALEAATGSTAGIGDVHGVTVVDGELWVAVQAPGSVDGGVLALGDNARIVADEAELGLAGEEVDALDCVAGTVDPLGLWIDAPGAEGVGACRAATPGGAGVLVVSGAAGYESAGYLEGFGAWYVDPTDALLAQQLAGGGGLVLFDGEGAFETTFTNPGVGGGMGWDGSVGWTFQLLDLTTLQLSAPFRLNL